MPGRFPDMRPPKAPYSLPPAELFKIFETDPVRGLSFEEAQRRLAQFGPNEIETAPPLSPLKLFLAQFANLLIVILLIAAGVSFFVGDALEAVVILLIVLACAVLGFVQEWKADQALQALKRMAAPEAVVWREGRPRKIPAREVVPGDILLLAAGDKVAADARLFESINLKVDEAALTGESVAVTKEAEVILPEDTPLPERKNMVFAGTTVLNGRGRALVVATGKATEFGKIAGLIKGVEAERTPLERRLAVIGRWLGGLSLVLAAVAAGVGVLRGYPWLEMFIWGVSLAVAAVPESLPAVVTGALAIGVSRMARRNAIVKRLPAVETLGSTTVICTDKTGTLTKNEMTVRKIWAGGSFFEVTGTGFVPQGEFLRGGRPVDPQKHEALRLTLLAGLLCNDVEIEEGKFIGDPTEVALLVAALKARLTKSGFARVAEVPFDSVRKRMSVLVKDQAGDYWVFTKGSVESVLSACSRYLTPEGERPLTPALKEEILKVTEQMAEEALRVLAFAYRSLSSPVAPEEMEKDLVLVGLQGMIDPPRPEAKAAIKECFEAGIRVIMITGDHAKTALAIAYELGLVPEKDVGYVITAKELDRLSDEELLARLKKTAIFARVSPEHKLRIVKLLKKEKEIVAMTGDGVNDAPALKMADIGVAMGVTGTEVAKEAADIILADDNFATIVAAVEEGRTIFDNIKKYLLFLLSFNLSEILVLIAGFLAGLPLPLTAIHILWINLVTNGPPALALGVDPPAPDLMKRPPRPPEEGVFTRRLVMLLFSFAVLLFLILFPVYAYALKLGFPLREAQTILFSGFVILAIAVAYVSRSERIPIWKISPFANKWLNLCALGMVISQLLIVYVPFLNHYLQTAPIPYYWWFLLTLCALIFILPAELLRKLIY